MSPADRGSTDNAVTHAPRLERVGVAGVATLIPALLLAHATAALLHVEPGIAPGAVGVTWAVLVLGLVQALVTLREPASPAWRWGVAPTAAALIVLSAAGFPGALAVALCGTVQGWAQARLAHVLPVSVDGLLRARPSRSLGWSLLALLAVVQTARLATHEADPDVAWWVTTRNPAWAAHQCSAMYAYAFDLHRQGEANVYDDEHYPPFEDGGTGPPVTVENLAGYLECGFEYPPPFLVLPALALQCTNDYHVLRPVWFALNGLGFLALAVILGLFVGGARGRLALWLLPAVWAAVPTLQTFQFGQFHLSAFALAMAGMLAFERRRAGLGGVLLGASVITKLYPGVLLLLLASQRRWRAVVATLLGMAALTCLSLVVLGTDPYRAFISYKLPRMLDGSAFISPNEDGMLAAILTGITTVPSRLRILGMTFLPKPLGPWMGPALGLGIVAIVWRGGRRAMSRTNSVMLWLALLNLTVLQGPAAFCDYTTATHLWLLTFVGVDLARSRWGAAAAWLGWISLGTLIGTFPIPDDPTSDWSSVQTIQVVAASTLVMTGIALALNLWCATRTAEDEESAGRSR